MAQIATETEDVVQIDFDKIDDNPTIVGEIVNGQENLIIPEIQALLKHHQQQSMNYTDQRLAKVLEDIKKNAVIIDEHTAQLGEHDKLLQQHAQQIQALQQTQPSTPATPAPNAPVSATQSVPVQQSLSEVLTAIADNMKQPRAHTHATDKAGGNVLDSTLGTIGGVAHGIVDTAAFICESIIDLATLGKARRGRV